MMRWWLLQRQYIQRVLELNHMSLLAVLTIKTSRLHSTRPKNRWFANLGSIILVTSNITVTSKYQVCMCIPSPNVAPIARATASPIAISVVFRRNSSIFRIFCFNMQIRFLHLAPMLRTSIHRCIKIIDAFYLNDTRLQPAIVIQFFL